MSVWMRDTCLIHAACQNIDVDPKAKVWPCGQVRSWGQIGPNLAWRPNETNVSRPRPKFWPRGQTKL